jgi:hypothetical protein
MAYLMLADRASKYHRRAVELGRSQDMAAIAHDAEQQQRELELGTRRAWSAYSQSLRGLAGDAYELAERDSWAELQGELRRLQGRPRSLNEPSG